jgi:hypothetical protein
MSISSQTLAAQLAYLKLLFINKERYIYCFITI